MRSVRHSMHLNRRFARHVEDKQAVKFSTNKYRNKKTVVDGIKFDSQREASRYGALKIMQAAKVISDLRLQVPYVITVNGLKICEYVADFVYIDKGREVVEDVKGMKTPTYNLKKKLMKAVHGIEIQEVK